MKPSPASLQQNQHLTGTLHAIAAFGLWGVLPIYWKFLSSVPSVEIFAHRVFWAFVFAFLMLLLLGRPRFLHLLKTPKNALALLATSLLIGINWFVYIFAVATDHVLAASMGYYINPLFSVFLGVVFLKERLTLWQVVALLLASCGVAVVAFDAGGIPWISLALVGSFGFYGLIKKVIGLDSLSSLAVESMFLSPLAFGYIILKAARGTGAFLVQAPWVSVLLVAAGAITALPLYWFAQAAQRIPLSRVGFIQYLAPTLMLVVGVGLYGEPFTWVQGASFGLIWAGIIVYLLSATPPFARAAAAVDKRIRARRASLRRRQ